MIMRSIESSISLFTNNKMLQFRTHGSVLWSYEFSFGCQSLCDTDLRIGSLRFCDYRLQQTSKSDGAHFLREILIVPKMGCFYKKSTLLNFSKYIGYIFQKLNLMTGLKE